MNEQKNEENDGQISLADMKLLVTAVISFDTRQIVSAFLDVQHLRNTLLHEVSKPNYSTVRVLVVLLW